MYAPKSRCFPEYQGVDGFAFDVQRGLGLASCPWSQQIGGPPWGARPQVQDMRAHVPIQP
jgi:hypothetical protein